MTANASNMHVAMSAVADKARDVARAMGLVDTSIANTEDKFDRLASSTPELEKKIREMRELRDALNKMGIDPDATDISSQ